MSKQTIVVLRITSDDPGRPWWESLGLPEPWRWNLSGPAVFPRGAFAEVELEADVALPLAPASREDDRI